MDASDPPAGEQASAERKLVTVLVCEVGEPTVAAGQSDVEDRDRLLAGALTTVQAEVARHGGLVVWRGAGQPGRAVDRMLVRLGLAVRPRRGRHCGRRSRARRRRFRWRGDQMRLTR